MKFKIDENLGKQAALVLRSAGYDIATVPAQKLCGATDKKLIAVCRQESRCLITLDLEFGNPLVFNPAEYSGIIVLRLPSRPSHQDILDILRTVASALKQRYINGKLWVVQKGRIREYQPEE